MRMKLRMKLFQQQRIWICSHYCGLTTSLKKWPGKPQSHSKVKNLMLFIEIHSLKLIAFSLARTIIPKITNFNGREHNRENTNSHQVGYIEIQQKNICMDQAAHTEMSELERKVCSEFIIIMKQLCLVCIRCRKAIKRSRQQRTII